jgi:GAF domain-containing protein
LLPTVIQAGDPDADLTELAYLRAKGQSHWPENSLATLAIIPLAVKGLSIGFVDLEIWDFPRSFTSEQLNLSMILANAAAVALENARLYEDQRQSAVKLRELDKLKSQFLANMSQSCARR